MRLPPAVLDEGKTSGAYQQVWIRSADLTALRRLSKMGRSGSILIGLGHAIPCRNEDEVIYNFSVEGFSRFDLEIGRKCTSLQAVTVLTGF